MPPELVDYQWLVSPAAEVALEQAAAHSGSLTSLVDQLRKQLSPVRTHLIAEQTRLRWRARSKFRHSDTMFFTARGLEQATDQRLAEFKASHFRRFATVMDLCCGVGGDLTALAKHTVVTGYDRDPICTTLAAANLSGLPGRSGHVVTGDVLPSALETAEAWHIDPDRRPRGRRTIRVELHQPSPKEIDQLLDRCPHGAIKLAPAAEVPASWSAVGERQWLGRGRECPQMWIRFGQLCQHPGGRSVTIVGPDSNPVATLVADSAIDSWEPSMSTKVERYLHEPHAAVLAADMVDVAATEFGLSRFAAGLVYLTSDAPVASPLIDSFEVLDVLPLDLKRIKSVLRQRNVGTLEVKRRGTGHDPVQLQRQLRGRGSEQATLLIAGARDVTWAILARRVS